MSRLGFKSAVYDGEVYLGELDVVVPSTDQNFKFPNNEIRIHHISSFSERCPPLSVLQSISPFSVRCKLESSSPVDQSHLTNLHASCFYELKTAVVFMGDEEVHLVAMPSKQMKYPCFWCYSVPKRLYPSCLRMLNRRCLAIVFDLDETLIVANTMKSFELRIDTLRSWIARETDPIRLAGMSAEMKRFIDDRALLKQYADTDCVTENGKLFKVQLEEVSPLSNGHETIMRPVMRPVIRLQDRNTVLTRINPEIRDTSVLVRLRPAWEDLRAYILAKGRKRFEVYVCTMADRNYALEIWRLLDPEGHLISANQLQDRIVCVKPESRKSLSNVFQDGSCDPKMAMVIDDRLNVWEEKDQPRVHVVPAFAPYYAPQAETANAVPVLCVARNVACNLRSYFFKEFDENLLRRISEVVYEDEFSNLPPALETSNYLMTEDTGCASNGNITAPMSEGMNRVEVEKRLNQAESKNNHPPDEKSAAETSSELKPETSHPPVAILPNMTGTASVTALMPSNRPSLLGAPKRDNSYSDGGRFLGLKPGSDLRHQSSGQPPLLSRFPAQVPSSSTQSHGGWLVEENAHGPSNNRLPGYILEPESSNPDKLRAHHNPVSHSSLGTSAGLFSNTAQKKTEEVSVGNELPKQKISSASQLAEKHQTESGNFNGIPTHLYMNALEEIGRRCSSKVEFRAVVGTRNDMNFSIEVLFTGETIGIGMGKTRKDAQQQAAENALRSLAEKYVAYMAPLTEAVDKDVDKSENGILWDNGDAESDEGKKDNGSPKEGTPEIDGDQPGDMPASLANRQGQRCTNSPRSLQSCPSKRVKQEEVSCARQQPKNERNVS